MKQEKLLEILTSGCEGKYTAIRSITRLQPADGPGGKVFPPTYSTNAETPYAFEMRLIDGKQVNTALIDSVQSQANRFEEVLLEKAQALNLPLFVMTVDGHEPITTLNAPHRVHDAIFRDSLWNGKPFRESEGGKRLVAARAWNATAFFEYAPTVLLFGTWDSQSGGGVNTAKIARCLVSEIIAYDAVPGVRTASRIDPLGIKRIPDVVMTTDDGSVWKFAPQTESRKDAKGKRVRPSEVNLGNIAPSITPGGVTFAEARQTTVLSFTQLRRLRFPDEKGNSVEGRDVAGRTVIAALALYAVALNQEQGYQLRSRCQLIPVESPKFELLGRTQSEREEFELDSDIAEAALKGAVEAAARLGLKWNSGRIPLEPRPDLVKLVEMSDRVTAVPEEA